MGPTIPVTFITPLLRHDFLLPTILAANMHDPPAILHMNPTILTANMHDPLAILHMDPTIPVTFVTPLLRL